MRYGRWRRQCHLALVVTAFRGKILTQGMRQRCDRCRQNQYSRDDAKRRTAPILCNGRVSGLPVPYRAARRLLRQRLQGGVEQILAVEFGLLAGAFAFHRLKAC
jgi:hypothetical protein